jgi:Coiled-coil domain-containing protein 56
MTNDNQALAKPAQNKRQRIRNYLIGLALIAFVVSIYALTWYKIATKSL